MEFQRIYLPNIEGVCLTLSETKTKEKCNMKDLLTFILPIMTKVPYAYSLDPNETLSYLASHPNQSCLSLDNISKILNDSEAA